MGMSECVIGMPHRGRLNARAPEIERERGGLPICSKAIHRVLGLRPGYPLWFPFWGLNWDGPTLDFEQPSVYFPVWRNMFLRFFAPR